MLFIKVQKSDIDIEWIESFDCLEFIEFTF